MGAARDPVLHLARLARVRLTPGEAAALEEDLERLLARVARLALRQDASGERARPPLPGPRSDTPCDGLSTEAVRALAPSWRDGCFAVPLRARPGSSEA